MKIRNLMLVAACVCVVGGASAAVATGWRHRQEAQRAAANAKFMQGIEQTSEWKQRAAAFDRHKVTAAAILTKATRVQVFRLAGQKGEKSVGKVAGLPYYAKSGEQRPTMADALAGIVLDPKTYPFPGQSTKQCYMEPGVDFRVWRGTQFVDVVICFQCNQLAVMENDPKVPETTVGGWLECRCYVAGDIDTVRPQLVALAKQALPDDAVFQKL